jgi:hypothetical protein
MRPKKELNKKLGLVCKKENKTKPNKKERKNFKK